MNEASPFSFSKWYLDCIAEDGDAFMGYAATLGWRGLSLEYSSILVRRSTGEVRTNATIHGGTLPTDAIDCVHWNVPTLKIAGIWQALERPLRRTMFASTATPLTWLCVQPRSWVEVDAGEFGLFSGYGYVDHVEMTTKPWQLPLDELRWGRFLSSTDSLIWMDIKGPFPESVVYHNGLLSINARVSDAFVDLSHEGLYLAFEDTHVLREGTLVSTALSVIPGVNSLLPARMLNADEHKWRSHGVLRKGDAVKSTGWAIHEVVKWPSSQ